MAVVSQRLSWTSISRAVSAATEPAVPVTVNHIPIGGLVFCAAIGLVFPSLTLIVRVLAGEQESGRGASMNASMLTVLPWRFMLVDASQRGSLTPACACKNELKVSDTPEVPSLICDDVLKIEALMFCQGSGGEPLLKSSLVWEQLLAVPLPVTQRP